MTAFTAVMCRNWFSHCSVAQGTNVASGKARGVVIGTGQSTEIGRFEGLVILLKQRHIVCYTTTIILYGIDQSCMS